jgi:DNA processing protein
MRDLLKYQIALTMIPGVGGITAKKLISYCGGIEALFSEKRKMLLKIPGIGNSIADAVAGFKDFDGVEREMEFIEKARIKTLFYLDKGYPARLKHCEDGPILLFFKGEANLNNSKTIAIVGTRSITEYGREKCDEIIQGLKKFKPLIVSGLAYGVDGRAHKTAMDHQLETVGVLGHGLDRIYPPLHKGLADRMLHEGGGLLSDFVSGTKPDRENFPKRNRIIAGLADALIVIEAARSGGALITANIANSYNRDVFAVPGRTSDTFSQGCNLLIKSHKAALAESAADIEYVMNWLLDEKKSRSAQQQLFVELDDDEQKIVDTLRQNGESSFDYLVNQSQLGFSKTSALLLNLEFKGVLKPLPGRVFKLVNS